jgi:hypothetical protein
MGKDRTGGVQDGGISGRGLAEAAEKEPLGGTGGSAGSGTVAGEGEPSGADSDAPEGTRGEGNERGALFEAADEFAGRTQSEEAAEAGALGPSPGSLAEKAGVRHRPEGAPPAGGGTIGDALRSGEEPQAGSGTPPDKSGLSRGEPEAEEGATGPSRTRSPGDANRR